VFVDMVMRLATGMERRWALARRASGSDERLREEQSRKLALTWGYGLRHGFGALRQPWYCGRSCLADKAHCGLDL